MNTYYTQELRQHVGRVLATFEPHDAGFATMPADLLALRDRLRAVEELAASPAEVEPEHTALDWLGQDLAESAGGVEQGLEVALGTLQALRTEREDAELRRGLVDKARAVTASRLVDAVRDRADELITEHLAPAQADAITQVRTAAAAFAPFGQNMKHLLTAPKAARDAFISVDEQLARYTALRAARGRLVALSGEQQLDEWGYFTEIRNTEVIWPEISGQGRPNPATAPWPTTGREHLLWLASPEVEPWCPTVAQQNDRWREVFGERLRQAQQNRQQLQGFASVFR